MGSSWRAGSVMKEVNENTDDNSKLIKLYLKLLYNPLVRIRIKGQRLDHL